MYNYYEAVREDVREYVVSNYDADEVKRDYAGQREAFEELLNDTLWTEDSVTGNGSGSYTFNAWQAEENLAHNWDEVERVAAEFGDEPVISDGYKHGAEWWDVSIRCYYLAQAISEVLDDFESDGLFDEEEDEDDEADE